jgi:DHA3 family macrolide efflux protein-like MFS transporter
MTWGGFKNRRSSICLGNYIFAVTTALFGIVPLLEGTPHTVFNFGLYIAVMVVCGIAMPFFSTPFTVMMQEIVEPEYMGRVFSFNSMVMSLGMPLGLVILGPLGDTIGLGTLFLASGVVQLVISVIFQLNRDLKIAGRPRPQDARQIDS